MKKLQLLIALIFLGIASTAQTTTTINFDTTGDWTAGSGSLSSYQADHTFTKGLFSASTSMDALRQSSAAQNGFPGANGTFAWRLRNSGTGAWTANIASNGVSTFSVGIRRWDASPNPNYTLDYSTDGGTSWTNVATINNTTLSNSSAYTTFNGTINNANANIQIRVNRVGGERLMIDDFVWTDFLNPVPVILKSFTAKKLTRTNEIAWTTVTELNNNYFNVMRSADGQSFETLGTVHSKSVDGNSSAQLNYSFVDEKPTMGHNYYRLEQVDMDNTKSYTQVIDIVWGGSRSEISIYPNPAMGLLNIDISAAKAAQTEIKLLDMSGRVVKNVLARTANGMNHISFEINDLVVGVYAVQVFENGKLVQVKKVRKN